MGLNACPDFVHPSAPSLDRLLDHAAHMSEVMGPGHVDLGLDLLEYLPGYEDKRLPGLADASEAPAITAGLLARGASEGEIRGLLGENWLHMWRRVLP